MNKDDIDIRNFDLVFFDCEFTGLTLKHEIIEIGWVKVRAKTFEVISEKVIKARPVRLEMANPDSMLIAGYAEKDWADAVDLKTALVEFLKDSEGAMLAGHNVAVDLGFLKKSLEECGLEPNFFYKAFDTFNMAWAKLHQVDTFKKFSLSELALYFNLDMGTHHRALDDARVTYQVFKKLMELP
jgi:DNA polymerase III epsilon subunit-like protein